MLLSITHRATGVALYAGSLLIMLWLWSAAYNATYYQYIYSFMGSIIGRLLLIGWTAAFYFHLANGIRHLWWDMGKGFEIPEVYRTGWTVIVFTVLLTALTWWLALSQEAI